jgi:hypothetical protein
MNPDLLANAFAVVVGIGVGSPILLRGLRTGDKPAIYLGLAVFLEGFEWLMWSLAVHTPLAGTPLGNAAEIACRFAIAGLTIAVLSFTLHVFRKRSRVATGFCVATALTMSGAIVASAMSGDWAGSRTDTPWVWIESIVQLCIFAWIFAEPAVLYRDLRRRARIGLDDPVLTNRILLWSIYGAGFTLSQAVWLFELAVYDDVTALDAMVAGASIVGQIAVGLAFFPPARYLGWIRSRTAPAV